MGAKLEDSSFPSALNMGYYVQYNASVRIAKSIAE